MKYCNTCVHFEPRGNDVVKGTTIKKATVVHVSDLNPGRCSHWGTVVLGKGSCQDHKAE